ncbi:hypothetical protein KBD45_02635 [Candidatus Dojkabacteria bacterium]|nr:hypothetical protein [Candidatus Dojkabacteria bacterium]
MKNLSDSVLGKIKEQNIKPIPKWEFLLKEYFIKGLFILNLLFGSIGFGIVIYLITNSELISDPSLVSNVWEWLIIAVPFVWILLTIIFVFVAYYNFRHTNKGYKFSVFKILLINIGISLILGIIFNVTGVSQKLNDVFAKNIPFYTHSLDLRTQVWMRPNEGYLAGTIIELNSSNNKITLKDLNGQQWNVNFKDALVRGRVKLELNEQIKLIGKVSSENNFDASELRPWNGRGKNSINSN